MVARRRTDARAVRAFVLMNDKQLSKLSKRVWVLNAVTPRLHSEPRKYGSVRLRKKRCVLPPKSTEALAPKPRPKRFDCCSEPFATKPS